MSWYLIKHRDNSNFILPALVVVVVVVVIQVGLATCLLQLWLLIPQFSHIHTT